MLTDGQAAAQVGMDSAVQAAPLVWVVEAKKVLDALIRQGRPFNAVTVWLTLDALHIPEPAEPRALGGLIRSAYSAGRIVPCGWETTLRPQAHGRSCRVWVKA